jgi:hypothetical protein
VFVQTQNLRSRLFSSPICQFPCPCDFTHNIAKIGAIGFIYTSAYYPSQTVFESQLLFSPAAGWLQDASQENTVETMCWCSGVSVAFGNRQDMLQN